MINLGVQSLPTPPCLICSKVMATVKLVVMKIVIPRCRPSSFSPCEIPYERMDRNGRLLNEIFHADRRIIVLRKSLDVVERALQDIPSSDEKWRRTWCNNRLPNLHYLFSSRSKLSRMNCRISSSSWKNHPTQNEDYKSFNENLENSAEAE